MTRCRVSYRAMPLCQICRTRTRVPATFRTDDGAEHGTPAIELPEDGNRLRAGIDAPDPGAGASIAIGSMAAVSAHLQWRYRALCGIACIRPLAGGLVDNRQHSHARRPLPDDPISVPWASRFIPRRNRRFRPPH